MEMPFDHNIGSDAELKAFANSQTKVILSQSQRINALEAEVEDLKEKLLNSTPVTPDPNSSIILIKDLTDEQAIAVMELRRLKETSLRQELSSEESKKYAIYVKAMIDLRGKSPEQEHAQEMNTGDLLRDLTIPGELN